jgi:hypothetical protein
MSWLNATLVAAALGAAGCFAEGETVSFEPATGTDVVGPTDPAWPALRELPAAFELPPWLTLPGDGSVAVGWQSSLPSLGWLELVAAPGGELEVDWRAARRIDSPAAGVLHHVRLTALAPATAYRYRVHVHDGVGGGQREGVFVTPGSADFRFVHLAEFHAPGDAGQVERAAGLIRDFRPHLVVESGDMVDDGDEPSHWRSYLRTSAPWISNVFLLPAHSNHVNGDGGNPLLLRLFELPDNERWYTTRFGQVEFVTLDSTYTANDDVLDEPAWLRDRMAATLASDAAPSRVVGVWHYPACSSSYPSRSGERRWVLEHFIAAFRAIDALDLVLVGHDKYYERSRLELGDRTVTHVMVNVGRLAPGSSGGNEPECSPVVTHTARRSVGLYDVAADVIRGTAVAPDGAVLDRFTIE